MPILPFFRGVIPHQFFIVLIHIQNSTKCHVLGITFSPKSCLHELIPKLGGGRSILPSYGNNTFAAFSSIMIIAAFCEKIKSIIDDLLYCLATLRRLFRLTVFRTENFVIWTNRLSLKAERNRRERFRPSRAFPFLRCFSYRKKAPFPIWETAACIRKSCPKSYRKT